MKTQINKREENFWPGVKNILSGQQQNELYETCLPMFYNIMENEKFSHDVVNDLLLQFKNIHIPLGAWIANKHADKPLIIGINGAQGSGKSTLSRTLQSLLASVFNKSAITLSIDDLYLAHKERLKKSQAIHPLLKVRGVPGTHDVKLANEILSGLTDKTTAINIPVFNKAQDDLLPEDEWTKISTPVDIVLFEGWCVGAKAQDDDELNIAVNKLEEEQDQEFIWRKYVNKQLADSYQDLFNKIDYLIMLKVPDMESVFEWRTLQEQKLAAACREQNKTVSHVMSEEEIRHFIMHYERITRWCLKEMPARADILLELNKQHQVHRVKIKASHE